MDSRVLLASEGKITKGKTMRKINKNQLDFFESRIKSAISNALNYFDRSFPKREMSRQEKIEAIVQNKATIDKEKLVKNSRYGNDITFYFNYPEEERISKENERIKEARSVMEITLKGQGNLALDNFVLDESSTANEIFKEFKKYIEGELNMMEQKGVI